MINPSSSVYPVDGVEVKTVIIDHQECVVKHILNINWPQFIATAKNFTNERGFLSLEIVKRRTPSPKGHTHLPRFGKAKDISYNPIFATQLRKLCSIGVEDLQIAEFFDVTDMMLKFWLVTYPEFKHAYTQGKMEFASRYEVTRIDYNNKPNQKGVK
jgi:hypothetical protein